MLCPLTYSISSILDENENVVDLGTLVSIDQDGNVVIYQESKTENIGNYVVTVTVQVGEGDFSSSSSFVINL